MHQTALQKRMTVCLFEDPSVLLHPKFRYCIHIIPRLESFNKSRHRQFRSCHNFSLRCILALSIHLNKSHVLIFSFKYNRQDATLYNILYYCQRSTCLRRFLRPSSGAQKLYTQHRVYAKLACCYRQRGCSNSPTLAVAANKLRIYAMLCVQFLSS